MKYDENIPATQDMVRHSNSPLTKAIWLRRLGQIYFNHGDLIHAQIYFEQARGLSPHDVDVLNADAVVCLQQGQEMQGLNLLKQALAINPDYPDTLRTLGLYYYLHKNFSQARFFLSRCLVFDPNNAQAAALLRQISLVK